MGRNVFKVCGSRGPRIGNSGVPYCAKPLGHNDLHRGFPGSGFEHEQWGGPDMIDHSFAVYYQGPIDLEDPLTILLDNSN